MKRADYFDQARSALALAQSAESCGLYAVDTYCIFFGLPTEGRFVNVLSKKAAKYCREEGVPIGKISRGVSTVNVYYKWVLDEMSDG